MLPNIDGDAEPVPIVLVSRQRLLVEPLQSAFREEARIEVVALFSDKQRVTSLHRLEPRPQVAVIDLELGTGDALDLTSSCVHGPSQCSVVVLAGAATFQSIRRAVISGARGYVTRLAGVETLIQAIQQVSEGQLYLDGAATEVLFSYQAELQRARADDPAFSGLSPREQEVYELIALGYSTKAMSAYLGVSPKSVETYRLHIYAKLGLSSPLDIVRHAVEQGHV